VGTCSFAKPLLSNGSCIFAYLTVVAQERVCMLQLYVLQNVFSINANFRSYCVIYHAKIHCCILLIAFVAATIHCRQPKEDNREDIERKVELAAVSHARRSGSDTKVAKSAYQFCTVIPQYNENLENMYVCTSIRVGHKACPCTATFNDLLCFPFRLALY
jgi:hypothetical protein